MNGPASPGGLGHAAGWSGISRRAAALVAAVAIGGLLALSEGMHGRLIELYALADPLFARHTLPGLLLFVGLAALSAMLAFFSSVLLVPIGIKTWGAGVCFLLLWLGWFLGGLCTYAAGRHLGRPVVRRILGDERIARYEGLIPHRGSFLPILAIQLVIPSDVSGYFFGLVGCRASLYLGALAIAEFPYALGTVFLGTAFVHRQSGLLLSAAAVSVAFCVWFWLRRRRRPLPRP